MLTIHDKPYMPVYFNTMQLHSIVAVKRLCAAVERWYVRTCLYVCPMNSQHIYFSEVTKQRGASEIDSWLGLQKLLETYVVVT